MMNKIRFNRERFNKDIKRAFNILTVVTNCFIISGVIHHWKPRAKPIYNYTGIHNNKEAWTHEVPHTHSIRSRLHHGHRQGRL